MHDRGPCTLERRCSSAGALCSEDDRSCQNDATGHGLEIVCETAAPRSYVYCPPGAQQRDSPVVWVLLLVALIVAVIGGALAIIVFRRRLSE